MGKSPTSSWIDGQGQIGSGDLAESFLSIFIQKQTLKT